MSGTSDRNDVDGLAEGRGRARSIIDSLALILGQPRDLGASVHRGRTGVAALVVVFMLTVAAGHPASASPADDAMRSTVLAGKLAEFRQACSDEVVGAKPTVVKVGPQTTAVLVKLTSSKGLCFGQPGENDYLLVEGPAGWRNVLAAEPGSIQVGRPDVKGFAVVTLYGPGMCKITYRRATSGFRGTPSKDCHDLNGSPSLLDVAKTVRD